MNRMDRKLDVSVGDLTDRGGEVRGGPRAREGGMVGEGFLDDPARGQERRWPRVMGNEDPRV